MAEITKHYSNDDLTIVWQPSKCIHAAECVKALPKVYNPNEKPWLKIENATTDELKSQIASCPSGALSYFMKGEENQEFPELETKVEVKENGPLLVYGTLHVTKADGHSEVKNKTTAFCRCGASHNKPYCDGSHIKEQFIG
jgi:uncharacterized Fe-S cluster protein YjdI